jgi:hypothetical protein
VNVGRPDIWQNQHVLVHKNNHKIVKQTLVDQFKQRLFELHASNKGRIYSLFKNTLEYEKYFNIIPKESYITLFRFRTCNNRLPI